MAAIAIQAPPKLPSLARQWGISRLAIFGSCARGEELPDSDVDVLAEFKPGKTPSLIGHLRLQEELSGAFGRRADLSTFSSIKSASNVRRRESILAGAVDLFRDA